MFDRLRTLALVGCFVSSMALAAEPDDILGSWITSGGQSHIAITRDGDEFVGHIVRLLDPVYWPGEVEGRDGEPRLDLNNPDAELAERPLQGMLILAGFQFDGQKWRGGSIYDPTRGKSYSGEIELQGDGRLRIRGFVKFRWMGRSTHWTPIGVYRDRMEAFLEFDCD